MAHRPWRLTAEKAHTIGTKASGLEQYTSIVWDFATAFGLSYSPGRNDVLNNRPLMPSPEGEGLIGCVPPCRCEERSDVAISRNGNINNRTRYAAGRGRPALPTASPRIGYVVIHRQQSRNPTQQKRKQPSTNTRILAGGGSPPRWLTVRAAHRRYSITLHKKRRAERFVVFVISLYRYRVFQALVRSE